MHSGSWGKQRGTTPTGVAVFVEDVAIRAMEVPDLLVTDVRSFFHGLR